MIHFTKYAEQKFEILNRYKVYITREDVIDAVTCPEKVEKKGKYSFATCDNLRVVFKKEMGIFRIYTFYPTR